MSKVDDSMIVGKSHGQGDNPDPKNYPDYGDEDTYRHSTIQPDGKAPKKRYKKRRPDSDKA